MKGLFLHTKKAVRKRTLRPFCLLILFILLLSSCTQKKPHYLPDNIPLSLENKENTDTTQGLLNPDAEIRGVWIASVGNINYPSKKGLSATALSKELDEIVENCVLSGINTIYFQVRPCADALYASELFPASEYVSGKQGKAADKSFDSLGYLIEIAHKNKINVHAWINPLRVTYGSAAYPKTDPSALSDGHPAKENPDWAVPYADGKLYFDAGIPSVRAYIAAGVSEVVENYAVDGVIFDDYFYPYPVSDENGTIPFDDAHTYNTYGSGFESIEDWRRNNINELIKECYFATKNINSECQFGVSPFGIWQNSDGENGGSETKGLEAYQSLYCDALAWAKGGYVDYLAPQLYWRFETSAAPYGHLVDWWSARLDQTSVKLLISHAAYMYESWQEPSGELLRQVEYARNALNYRGSIFFGYEEIKNNTQKIKDELDKLFEFEIIYSDPVQK